MQKSQAMEELLKVHSLNISTVRQKRYFSGSFFLS